MSAFVRTGFEQRKREVGGDFLLCCVGFPADLAEPVRTRSCFSPLSLWCSLKDNALHIPPVELSSLLPDHQHPTQALSQSGTVTATLHESKVPSPTAGCRPSYSTTF